MYQIEWYKISSLPERKLIALQKVLDYMNDRSEQMNLDAAFGVTLTEGKDLLYSLQSLFIIINND